MEFLIAQVSESSSISSREGRQVWNKKGHF